MRNILFEETAIKDLEFWAKNDLKTLKKTIELVGAIGRMPFEGIGKPELLKENLKGFWSRRINHEHRIIYAADNQKIIIVSCRTHYDF